MALIDKSHGPRPGAKKPRSVTTFRSGKDGTFVTVKKVAADSKTLGGDLRYVFTSNVRSVTRKK